MFVVTRDPVEVLTSRRLPPAVFAEAMFTSDKVIPGHHTAGYRLVHPNLCFRGRLRDIPPSNRSRRIRACDIRAGAAFHDRLADASLFCAHPHRRIVSAASLVVTIKPIANLFEQLQIWRGPNAAAEVGKVEIVRLLFFRNGIVELPQIKGSLIKAIPISRSPSGGKAAALFAIADR